MKKKYDVVVLTEDRYELPESMDIYVNNVIVEDALLVNALINEGLSVGRFAWSNKSVDWNVVGSVVFRSTWDYFDRYPEFSIWLKSINGKVKLFNAEEIIHWNLDKIYLEELAEKGIAIPKTYFIKKGDQRTLLQVYNDAGFGLSILKPNVSGAARHTYKLDEVKLEEYSKVYSKLISEEDFMIQEFQKNIHTRGEISLILIDGECTHAVLKEGTNGDFRVQDDFGGTVKEYIPNKTEIEFANQCYDVMETKPLYCRVDLMWDNNDQLVLSELEMIEPELWFRNCPVAAIKLAKAIKNKI